MQFEVILLYIKKPLNLGKYEKHYKTYKTIKHKKKL